MFLKSLQSYMAGVWDARYFWTHLAFSDLRSRWRRSFFGVLWSLLQPLGMTLLISVVFSRLFKTDITKYAPYILSGIVVWDFMIANVTGGALSFVQADAYIKQCNHPLAIYTLRGVLSSLVVLFLASIPLVIWSAIVLPENIGYSWFSLLLAYPVLGLIAWPLSTVLAYMGARFRDIPHAMTLVMQAVWFVSPVYFEDRIFRDGGISGLVDYNPVYHVLQLFRAPLLSGHFPTSTNIAFGLGSAAVLGVIAVAMGRKLEKKIIFYL